jgi:hypothetical protein
MIAWAAVVALVLGVLTFFAEDPSSVLYGAAELGGVITLFALVCAAEAFN